MSAEYSVEVEWTGDLGDGTASYRTYSRDHVVRVDGKPVIAGSSDPMFRGDPARHNPEDLLLASLSACHMLWFLHLCADAGVVVRGYRDRARGRMTSDTDGSARFAEVVLAPEVRADGIVDAATLESLHHRAHELCYIARSVAFPVVVRPTPVGTGFARADPPQR